jgi:hypothetical protein
VASFSPNGQADCRIQEPLTCFPETRESFDICILFETGFSSIDALGSPLNLEFPADHFELVGHMPEPFDKKIVVYDIHNDFIPIEATLGGAGGGET